MNNGTSDAAREHPLDESMGVAKEPNVTQQKPIEEEPLPRQGEGPSKEPPPARPSDAASLNRTLPVVTATLIYGRASAAKAAGRPPTIEELAANYVHFTGSILEMVDFAGCLGEIEDISPTARLCIGIGALVVGAVVFRMPAPKEEDDEAATD